MLAHIVGVPFEEWLVPLTTTGSGIALAVRLAMSRLRRRSLTPR